MSLCIPGVSLGLSVTDRGTQCQFVGSDELAAERLDEPTNVHPGRVAVPAVMVEASTVLRPRRSLAGTDWNDSMGKQNTTAGTAYAARYGSGLGGATRNGWGRYPDRDAPPPLTQRELLELRQRHRGQTVNSRPSDSIA